MRLALFNPQAGLAWRGGQVRRARSQLERMPDVVMVPTTPGRITAQTRELLTPDVSAVFACGGDGTVSDVAAGLVGTDIPLCIVPCGTTNVLAREFGIPLDPVEAIAATSQWTTSRTVRTWTIGDRPLVLGAGIGWDARLMHRASPGLKRRFGFGALMPLALGLAVSYDFPSLTVTGVDGSGNEVTHAGCSILISNIRYWSGANPAIRGADPTDDLIEVVVLERDSLAQLLAFWSLMMLPGGNPLGLSGVQLLQLRSLTVTSTAVPSPEVHVNGDAAGRLPIVVRPGGHVHVRVGAAEPPRHRHGARQEDFSASA
jgi:diacylglycerol kinase (ATP)